MNKTAWIFPGQGAHFVGMGKDIHDTFPESRVVFERAEEVLGFKPYSPKQIVISGSLEAVRLCMKLADEQGNVFAG